MRKIIPSIDFGRRILFFSSLLFLANSLVIRNMFDVFAVQMKFFVWFMVRFVCTRNVKWIRFSTSMCREPVLSAANENGRTCASRILHVNYNVEHTESLLLTCAHTEKPNETNKWPNATYSIDCYRFALLHLDRGSLMHGAFGSRVCVHWYQFSLSLSCFGQNDHSSSSLPNDIHSMAA